MSQLRTLWPSTPAYVLDSKADPKDFGGWRGIVEQSNPPRPLRDARGVQVWRPPSNDLGAYDDWFQSILETRKPAIILVDELASVSSKSGDAVLGYQLLQKQGRGHNICMVTLSQEMANTARQAAGQATHLVRFALMNAYDRRTANAMMGRPPKGSEPPHQYGFWYQRLDKRPYKPIYYSSWKAFF